MQQLIERAMMATIRKFDTLILDSRPLRFVVFLYFRKRFSKGGAVVYVINNAGIFFSLKIKNLLQLAGFIELD